MQGGTCKERCDSACGWGDTCLGVLYRHLSNIRLSLEEGKGMPALREGDRSIVDLVEAGKVEVVREGYAQSGWGMESQRVKGARWSRAQGCSGARWSTGEAGG